MFLPGITLKAKKDVLKAKVDLAYSEGFIGNRGYFYDIIKVTVWHRLFSNEEVFCMSFNSRTVYVLYRDRVPFYSFLPMHSLTVESRQVITFRYVPEYVAELKAA